MPTATQATPSISVSSSGLITASATQSAGYVSAGTKSATQQLTTKGATTITPSTSAQTAVASGVYTTGAITVAAMPTATQATPSISINSSGLITASATQTAGYVAAGTKSATKQLTTKGATTYTPGTSNQTIAASTYLTGVQTIKGDSNLVAGNIKKGVSIFGVSGSYDPVSTIGGTVFNNSNSRTFVDITTLSGITKTKISGSGSSAIYNVTGKHTSTDKIIGAIFFYYYGNPASDSSYTIVWFNGSTYYYYPHSSNNLANKFINGSGVSLSNLNNQVATTTNSITITDRWGSSFSNGRMTLTVTDNGFTIESLPSLYDNSTFTVSYLNYYTVAFLYA